MKAKKIFKGMTAAAVAAVLAASMVPMTAFAAGVTITVKPVNNLDEHATTSKALKTTYNIYKVFDANYAVQEAFKDVSVTMTKLDNSTDKFSLKDSDADKKLSEYCSATANPNNYKANIKALTDALVPAATAPAVTVPDITADTTVTLDSNCYYLVVPTADAQMNIAPSLITAASDLTVAPKTSSISVDKSIESVNSKTDNVSTSKNSAAVKIGDTVSYSIKSQIPSYADAVKEIAQDYTITDTPTAGLSIKFDKVADDSDPTDGIVVEITGGTTATKGTDYTITKNTGDGGFKVVFSDAYVLANGGKDVVVKFDAEVNENAVVNTTGNVNDAKVSFDNDYKEANSEKPTDIDDKVTVYRTKMDFVKEFVGKDGQKKTTPIAGASFTLSKKNSTGTYEQIATFTTTATVNSTTFERLDVGDYKLEEIKAPEGYAKLAPVEFTIAAPLTEGGEYNGVFNFSTENSTLKLEASTDGTYYTGTITNVEGQTLPGTGGMGTIIFTVAGAGVVLVAGIMLIVYMKKRKIEE